MADILTREELERKWRWTESPEKERRYRDTALWLAEKGRLAGLGAIGICTGCEYEGEECLGREGAGYPCEVAARELLEWWGEDDG